MWELQAGEDRDLSRIFRSVAGAHVKELVIRDPYCGAVTHRLKLKVFLEALTRIMGKVCLLYTSACSEGVLHKLKAMMSKAKADGRKVFCTITRETK